MSNEPNERRRLGRDLVVLCGLTPASVWEDPLVEPSEMSLKGYFARMPLEDLRELVSTLARSKCWPAKFAPPPSPPPDPPQPAPQSRPALRLVKGEN